MGRGSAARRDRRVRVRRCGEADFDAIVAIVNDAARAYAGVIPADRYHEPYMSAAELAREIADGVAFWGLEEDGRLVAVMGLQEAGDVCLIRHAYVRTAHRRRGLGAALLHELRARAERPLLVGTWAAADWAIRFYRKHGFERVPEAETAALLRRYWSVPARQIETSVVLAEAAWLAARRARAEAGGPADPKGAIRDRALGLGFDAIGFAPAALPDSARQDLAAYLARGYHGDMGWLAAKAGRRGDPRALWPEARSVVVVGLNYGPAGDPLARLAQPDRGAVSVYARNRDYHDVLKKRLKALARWMAEDLRCRVKVFVDTAPVMEKPLAQAAGIGWQGKHTNLVSRDFGSWLFLGEVYTDLALAPDAAERDFCGTCRRCLDACPTDAFPAPYRLDARRCISYLTIEHKGHIAPEFRAAMGNRIYGCDDCLAVCPWNKFAARTAEPAFLPRAELDAPRLADLARLDEAGFRALFAGTAIKRTGRERFVRNVLIALGNAGDAAQAPVAESLLDDSSALVRAMAVWALSRLADRDAFVRARDGRLAREPDAYVRAEWARATAERADEPARPGAA